MLERLKQQVSPYLQARRWYIAYSGGLDSHVLLHSLAMLARQNPYYPPLLAIHINHQIQSVANKWESHCQQQALDLGVEYCAYRVDVDASHNIEEGAREARYAVFNQLLEEGDCIFFAHHQQDNIETFFYRLFRGAGIKGLAAMPPARKLGKGELLRPFLTIDRPVLEDYARLHQLQYVEDPSNRDSSLDRNYLRWQLLPVIAKRWPAFNAPIQRLLSHLNDINTLLDDLAVEDLQAIDMETDVEPSINISTLLSLSEPRQKNAIRYWLLGHGLVLSSRQTQELFQRVIHANEDAMPVLLLGKIHIRRYRTRLYLTGSEPQSFADIDWNGMEHCIVPGYGILVLSQPLALKLVVKSRQGSEQIKPHDSNHSRKLKTLLQEMGIPPWRRNSLPLIYCDNKLIAVGELIRAVDADVYLPNIMIQKFTIT